MKYQILEEICCIEKNNGEVFKVNKIKWRNAFKYDIRIWRYDLPMQGITLSRSELKDLCEGLLAEQGEYNPDDNTLKKEMASVNLKEVLKNHPECFSSSSKIRAILRDCFPGQNLEINILCNIYDVGLSKIIQKTKELDKAEVQRLLNLIENEYGMKNSYGLWGIKTWAEAYGVKCDIEISDICNDTANGPLKNKNKKALPIAKKENNYSKDDDIINNNDIQVTYKGLCKKYQTISSIDFVFYIKNKTPLDMVVEMRDAEINDYRVKTIGKLFLKANSQTISSDMHLKDDDLSLIGIKQIKDIKKLKVDFIYVINGKIERKELMLVPQEV